MKHRFMNILDMKKKRSGKMALLVLMSILTAGSLVACGETEPGNTREDGSAETAEKSVVDTNAIENESSAVDFEEIAEEEIYEVLDAEDAAYYATAHGIYRVTEEGAVCIYDKAVGEEGFSGTEPHMCVYENRLYFKTDAEYKDGNMDWQDNGIRQVDLETLQSHIVMSYLSGDGACLTDYYVGDGFLTFIVLDSTGEEQYKTVPLEEKGKLVYNGKALEALTEDERQEFGLETRKWLLENPGKLLSVANRTFAETLALLDLDGEGSVEEITLRPNGNENYAYSPFDHYMLTEGDRELKADYAENMVNDIWAISLNGEDILLVLYADGPSGDPMTWFYSYENGSLQEVGTIATDIRSCEITEDGVISGVVRRDVIQTDFVTAKWQSDESGMLVEIPLEYYEFTMLNEVQMRQELVVYTEPDGVDSFVLEAQPVKFTKASGDLKWLFLETLTGDGGWLKVIDYMTVEQNKNTLDVFEMETMIFAG